MYNPSDAPTPPAPPSSDSGSRTARYAYLVGRLRSRQITMEEATELFSIMQITLSRSEAGRLAAMAAASANPSLTAPVRATPPPAPGTSTSGGSDDFLLLGLLAMGAGVGLLAAMTKRIQELGPPATPPSRGDRPAASP